MAFPDQLNVNKPQICVAITPNDNTTFAPCLGFWIGTAGTITYTGHDGTNRTHTVGTGWFPFGGTKVLSTGTTASNIGAGY